MARYWEFEIYCSALGGETAFSTKEGSLVQLVNFAYGSMFSHGLSNVRETTLCEILQLLDGKEAGSLVLVIPALGRYIHHHFSWSLII